MQDHDWNDLKYILALYRTGKLTDAGRTLGVSETTVARRIKVVERSLGIAVFFRAATGKYEATDSGLHILDHAETIESENIAIREKVGRLVERVTGVVRVSSVPIIVNRILVPNLTNLRQQHPDLIVQLVPESDNIDLSKREADLAIRFARPTAGGLQVKVQKLGSLEFGAFAPGSASPDEMREMGWIGYDDVHASLPQARWLETARARSGIAQVPLQVADAETAMEAVACGLGKTILPISIAGTNRRLQAISVSGVAPLPIRDLWLLSHVDQSGRSSVTAVKKWLARLPWKKAL